MPPVVSVILARSLYSLIWGWILCSFWVFIAVEAPRLSESLLCFYGYVYMCSYSHTNIWKPFCHQNGTLSILTNLKPATSQQKPTKFTFSIELRCLWFQELHISHPPLFQSQLLPGFVFKPSRHLFAMKNFMDSPSSLLHLTYRKSEHILIPPCIIVVGSKFLLNSSKHFFVPL